jgi:hypothetical protein
VIDRIRANAYREAMEEDATFIKLPSDRYVWVHDIPRTCAYAFFGYGD